MFQEVLDGGPPTMKGDIFSLAGNKIIQITNPRLINANV